MAYRIRTETGQIITVEDKPPELTKRVSLGGEPTWVTEEFYQARIVYERERLEREGVTVVPTERPEWVTAGFRSERDYREAQRRGAQVPLTAPEWARAGFRSLPEYEAVQRRVAELERAKERRTEEALRAEAIERVREEPIILTEIKEEIVPSGGVGEARITTTRVTTPTMITEKVRTLVKIPKYIDPLTGEEVAEPKPGVKYYEPEKVEMILVPSKPPRPSKWEVTDIKEQVELLKKPQEFQLGDVGVPPKEKYLLERPSLIVKGLGLSVAAVGAVEFLESVPEFVYEALGSVAWRGALAGEPAPTLFKKIKPSELVTSVEAAELRAGYALAAATYIAVPLALRYQYKLPEEVLGVTFRREVITTKKGIVKFRTVGEAIIERGTFPYAIERVPLKPTYGIVKVEPSKALIKYEFAPEAPLGAAPKVVVTKEVPSVKGISFTISEDPRIGIGAFEAVTKKEITLAAGKIYTPERAYFRAIGIELKMPITEAGIRYTYGVVGLQEGVPYLGVVGKRVIPPIMKIEDPLKFLGKAEPRGGLITTSLIEQIYAAPPPIPKPVAALFPQITTLGILPPIARGVEEITGRPISEVKFISMDKLAAAPPKPKIISLTEVRVIRKPDFQLIREPPAPKVTERVLPLTILTQLTDVRARKDVKVRFQEVTMPKMDGLTEEIQKLVSKTEPKVKETTKKIMDQLIDGKVTEKQVQKQIMGEGVAQRRLMKQIIGEDITQRRLMRSIFEFDIGDFGFELPPPPIRDGWGDGWGFPLIPITFPKERKVKDGLGGIDLRAFTGRYEPALKARVLEEYGEMPTLYLGKYTGLEERPLIREKKVKKKKERKGFFDRALNMMELN